MHTANTKTCPRCQQAFICKADDIANCQCSIVQLSTPTREWLTKQYSDCLCANCLRTIHEEVSKETNP